MKLTFSPVRMEAALSASVAGDLLVLNGQPVDLTGYSADPEAPHDWIIGQPERIGGIWHVTLVLPHGAEAPPETLFPAPVEVAEGQIPLPPRDPAPAAEDTGLSGG